MIDWSDLADIYRAFLWQVVTVGGFGAAYFLIPAAAIVAVLIVKFPRPDSPAKRYVPTLLLSLPTIWILMLAWASQVGAHPPDRALVEWANVPITVAFWTIPALMAFFIWRMKGGRAFAFAWSLLSLYITLVASILSAVAIGGAGF